MSTYNLCLDLGNTRAKLALFEKEQKQPLEQATVSYEKLMAQLETWHASYPIKNAILCSVVDTPADLTAWLNEHANFLVTLDESTRLPFINAYSSTDTLGPDRLALAAGARALYPNEASLVIALGTCITYNLILANGFFRGGAITPGMRMRFKSLNEFTDKLPLVEGEGPFPILGYDTDTSIRSGVVNGIVAEVAGMCAIYRKEMTDDFNAILTGGDMPFFEPKIKNKIFAAPDILLIGLHEILKHNVPLF